MPGPGRDRPFPAVLPPVAPAPASRRGPKEEKDASRMPHEARIAALKERHAALERRILDEDRRPRPDTQVLARLKLEKLRIKEELERLCAVRRN